MTCLVGLQPCVHELKQLGLRAHFGPDPDLIHQPNEWACERTSTVTNIGRMNLEKKLSPLLAQLTAERCVRAGLPTFLETVEAHHRRRPHQVRIVPIVHVPAHIGGFVFS